VREFDEIAQGVIPYSVWIPLSSLPSSLDLSSVDFEVIHGFSKPALGQEIVFYCRSGRRSAKACELAHQGGYNKSVCNVGFLEAF
jgi:thiosulfate:glutathione sulfurtransferase